MGEREVKMQKSYFDVQGLCCSSEVPLIERILQPLEGVRKVTVVVPSRTVIVVHDTSSISQLDLVKALNQARLEASIRAYGTETIAKKWPSPYILACGLLLLVSLFKYFFHPLKWVALAAVVVGLPPILLRSIAAVRRYTLDINILMVIAVGGAVAMRDYSEAGFIVFLFTIAEWLESRAGHKASAGMSLLMSMAPQKAVLAETGEVVDVQDVKINTILAVKAGEVIPIDGIVVDGRSEVDESSLTGESFPVNKQAESPVWAGTLNIDGYISVRTSALAENSAVAKMARLVEEAQNSRSKTQRLIDSCAKYYTPAVVVIAGAVAVIPLILKVHNTKRWFKFALVLLVSACPCALVLSTPVATFCALLKAARTGLLVKGADVLEALAKTRVVALDKTGTITKGEFTVMEFKLINRELTLDEVLFCVSSIESKSSHPMASALVDYARENSIEPKPEVVSEFRIYPGEGIGGEIEGKRIYVGNKRIAMRAGNSKVPNLEIMKEGVSLGYVFSDDVAVGIFTLSDTCRTGSAEAIKELNSLGVKTAMLTGDSNAAAMHAQNQLGNVIEVVHAELLPEDKVRIVSELKSKEGCTVMVGDGLNDAPALAMADVGISMGISGSAVAMETSHITLMSNDIRKIPKAIRLARKTHRTIIVNIFFSFITKIVIVALAIAGYPLLWAAVLADVGTCLVVILNSMMLLQTRTTEKKKHCHSSHQGHGQCCGSTHIAHTTKPACEDHCISGTCGSTAVCHQSKSVNHLREHSCHDSETTEVGSACKHSCSHDHKIEEEEHHRSDCFHDHGKEKEERNHHHCHSHGTGKEESTHTNCHDHGIGEQEKAHHVCLNTSMSEDCDVNTPCHSHYSAKSVAQTTNSPHEHLISITSGGDCHNDGLHEDHSGHASFCHEHDATSECCSKVISKNRHSTSKTTSVDPQLIENSEHCRSERDECGSKSCCLSTEECDDKRKLIASATSHLEENCCKGSSNHSHCDPEPVEFVTNGNHKHPSSSSNIAECHRDGLHEEHSMGNIAYCCKQDVHHECNINVPRRRHHAACLSAHANNGIYGCCETVKKVCTEKHGCSSSYAGISCGKSTACSRSYIKECKKKHRCCAHGMMQLPEIITE